jgi:CelD/BcsL family acetyltransferase involved in cellulose biosynthesis
VFALEILTKQNDFERLAPEWDALLERSHHPEPTQSPLWLRAWWRIYGQDGGRTLKILTVRESGRLVAVAPLLHRIHWYAAIPFRRLELIGSGESERDEIASEYLGFVIEADREAAVMDVIVGALLAGELGSWEEFLYPRVRPDHPVTRALLGRLQRERLDIDQSDPKICHYVPLPPTMEDYFQRLSSSRRQRFRRALRQFEQWSGQPLVLEHADNAASLERGIEILVELHQHRWEQEGQPGAFASKRFSQFHREVMPELLVRDALQLVWLSARGRPVAALYNVIWEGRAHFYQGGRATDVPTAVRPGLIIHLLAIAAGIARGLREYDFLAGDSRYKEELSLAHRSLVDVRVTRPGCVREATRTMLKKGVRHVRRLTGMK